MHHIFIEEENLDLLTNEIYIYNNTDNYNHLVNVLRTNIKEKILVSIISNTNNTFDYMCYVSNIDDKALVLNIMEKVLNNELPIQLTLIQGLPKQEKLEFIVDIAGELGVTNIIPVEMKNCVVKLDEKKKTQKIDRLNKILKSACEQSRRGIIAKVENVMSFKNAIEFVKDYKYKFLFYEDADNENYTTQNEIKNIDISSKVVVVIGPEGGFTSHEVEIAKDAGFKILSLGKRILRTEIAALTALSYIMMNFN